MHISCSKFLHSITLHAVTVEVSEHLIFYSILNWIFTTPIYHTKSCNTIRMSPLNCQIKDFQKTTTLNTKDAFTLHLFQLNLQVHILEVDMLWWLLCAPILT
jgi:hypothetical protein